MKSKTFKLILICLLMMPILSLTDLYAQQQFSRQDSLRGAITPERAWWDVIYYQLDVNVDIDKQFISGTNKIVYKVCEEGQVLQIDLQNPLRISKIIQNGKELAFSREGSAFFIHLNSEQIQGNVYELDIWYSGKPTVAANPPWDGGFTWSEDANGNPFVATANQGIGASVWWPNKDHPYDEPDSLQISVTVPDTLMNVSNGRLIEVQENNDGTNTWRWFVSNPINNYGVNINIGDYVHFGDAFDGEKGILDLDYYVLRDNLEKAREQFKQVKPMMKAFEHWFGPYPFYEDGYKLVEVPYLGMEHQSSVTYGNGYQNGYLGRDLSGSGWGLTFDFIIIHETAHEWFANSITNSDVADMWIHEGFSNYAESLYLDYHAGEQAANEYVQGLRLGISNDEPIIGSYNVNDRGSSDMYNKGGNLLHTLRQIVNDDSLWRATLRGMNKEFYHRAVSFEEVEKFISKKTGLHLSPFFNQYLRDTRIPTLEYVFRDGQLSYRWGNVVSSFDMPVDVWLNGETRRLHPSTSWQKLKIDTKGKNTLKIDPNYYVGSFNLLR